MNRVERNILNIHRTRYSLERVFPLCCRRYRRVYPVRFLGTAAGVKDQEQLGNETGLKRT